VQAALSLADAAAALTRARPTPPPPPRRRHRRYFVSIKASSWLGPLATAVLNEMTGSLRLAILSALVFYLPSLLIMAITDFDAAREEAAVASASIQARAALSTAEQPRAASKPVGEGAREHLLPKAEDAAQLSYGTLDRGR
jgi:hypothetical protein